MSGVVKRIATHCTALSLKGGMTKIEVIYPDEIDDHLDDFEKNDKHSIEQKIRLCEARFIYYLKPRLNTMTPVYIPKSHHDEMNKLAREEKKKYVMAQITKWLTVALTHNWLEICSKHHLQYKRHPEIMIDDSTMLTFLRRVCEKRGENVKVYC